MTEDEIFEEEIKRDFLNEVTGFLDECEESYLKLEDESCRVEELGKIFRAVHSMKGAGASVGFTDLASFAHVVEDCLSLLRNRPELVNTDVISILLKSGDEFKKCIVMLKSKDTSPWLIDDFKNEVKELTQRLSGNEKSNLVTPSRAGQEPEAGKNTVAEQEHKNPDAASGVQTVGSIKVDAERIESVLNIAGELLVLKSQLENHCKMYSSDGRLQYLLSLVDKSISEMHDRTLSMRMMPLKSLFLKTQRVIRDLSLKLGKPVDFQMSGETTEIDRTMVDILGDPLMHIARNSLDHGIENAETRKLRGKSESGTIHISAFQTGGRVVVKINDDGGGINREKVIKIAKEKGLLPVSTESTALTDKEVFDLLFAPGFSTADKVTDVSGRGVGMDVVKTNIERIKGIIEMETREGQGTSLTISLPLTTAITEGMIFKIASEFYIFPMDCIQQLIKLESSDLIKLPSGQEIVKYRNEIYSFFRLEEIFRDQITEISPDEFDQNTAGQSLDTIRVVLINTGKQTVAIRIDDVLGQIEAVLKPLGDSYRKADGISGAAILGSGRLALVLDPIGLERAFTCKTELKPDFELAS